MRRHLLAIAFGAALLFCGFGTRSDAQSPINVTMLFDGGYAFILGKQGNLTVGAFGIASDGHESTAHRMILRLTRGTFAGGKKPSTLNPGKPRHWDLAGLDVEPAAYGGAAGPVSLPPSLVADQACPKSPKFNLVDKAANAQSFFPDITSLGGSTVDTSPSRFRSRVLLAHGRLALRRALGCWEYRNNKGTVVGSRQALAAGLHSVKYNLTVPGDTFELRLSKIGGGEPESILVKPEWIEANKAWEVAFWVGRFSKDNIELLKPGKPMKHFERYYTLLTNPPPKDQQFLPHKQHRTIRTIPGDECSPGLFVEKGSP